MKSKNQIFVVQVVLCCAAALVCNSVSGQVADGTQKSAADKLAATRQKLNASLEKVYSASKMPGCSVSLILPYGDVVSARAGFANRETDRSMITQDRMMSGSIGKTYFAAIAAMLIRDARLSLNDPISKYLGDEEWFTRIPNAESITVGQLARHQSGIPRYILKRQLWKAAMENPDMSWRPGDQLKYVYDAKPLHPAGKGWAYSDTNYILLGLILEKVSGRSAYDLVKEKILDPCGLKDTIPNDRRKLPGLIQGYSSLFKSFGIPAHVINNRKFVFNPQMEWCGGGFLSTPSDLARWAHICFSSNAFDGDYLSILTDDAVDTNGMLGPGTRYGVGVMLRETALGKSLGHDGIFPGYTATMGYFPDHKIAGALMYNTDARDATGRPPHDLLVELIQSVVE